MTAAHIELVVVLEQKGPLAGVGLGGGGGWLDDEVFNLFGHFNVFGHAGLLSFYNLVRLFSSVRLKHLLLMIIPL